MDLEHSYLVCSFVVDIVVPEFDTIVQVDMAKMDYFDYYFALD